MTQTTERSRITSLAALRELFGSPSERAVKKELGQLDAHCRAFIERSPFALLGTAGAEGRCDVSPKGDQPGFAVVLDSTTLAIPDRPGNKRFDSLHNILQNPHVGLLFLIPGTDETLRVNGTAELVLDDELLDRLAVDGKRPTLAIVVSVEEAFLHCGRALLRASLWDPSGYVDRGELPSLARMISDQTRPADRSSAEHERVVAEAEARTAESYRCLY
jgi:PPOX class probable FMN-dependent enzyme